MRGAYAGQPVDITYDAKLQALLLLLNSAFMFDWVEWIAADESTDERIVLKNILVVFKVDI